MTERIRNGGVRRLLDRGLGWMLAALMGASVVNVLWQVVGRYLLGRPSSFTEELARSLLIWIALLGAAYAAGGRMHLAMDLLPQRLSGRAQMVLRLFIDGSVFAFALLALTVGGILLALRLDATSPALGIPVAYVYAALPVAGMVIMLYALLDALERIMARS